MFAALFGLLKMFRYGEEKKYLEEEFVLIGDEDFSEIERGEEDPKDFFIIHNREKRKGKNHKSSPTK